MSLLFNRQRVELILLVVIKAAFFYVIWLAFFSHPAVEEFSDKKMVDRLVGDKVITRVLRD